jgi:hypothetical protein
MTETLSITTVVAGLLTACTKRAIDLKEIYDGAAIADAAVKGLLREVEHTTRAGLRAHLINN